MKLSVAITSFNEAKNIGRCLESVKDLADEIIVVDEKSTDGTVKIVKKYTDKVFLVDHGSSSGKTHDTMFHKHKQLALDKCKNDWILQIDCDEELSPELNKEIITLTKDSPFKESPFWAYKVPRKNFIFGKWIEHTGWYPDYQIKLVRKGKAHYPCLSVHEDMVIDGEIGILKNDLLHHHYVSVEQFIDRMNRYTTDDVEFMTSKGENHVSWSDALKFPLDEFLKRFFFWEGYKDGLHGLVLSLLKAADREIVFAKLWEKQGHPELVSGSILNQFYKEVKKATEDYNHWKMMVEKNPIKKLILRCRNKFGMTALNI